ncbi:hypothetical protein HHI36_021595 [Cryptolaemus montrouzieri]|uniref:Cytochrome P450 n=1 Tax=Cryptolaemus montrouzieri TaxID=559131 RepID=A0ABD2MYL7_9CUCU
MDITSSNITSSLMLSLLTVFVLWIVKYHWSRRRLYELASKIPGPPGYPIVGNGFDWMGRSTKDLFRTGIKYCVDYPNVMKYWLGPKLMIAVTKPEYLQIIMNHPDCLEKDSSYRFLKKYVGNGLISAPVQIWKKNRKLIQPTFRQKILDSFVVVFVEHTKTLTDIMMKHAGTGEVDMASFLNAFMIDLVCETSMGLKTGAQTTGNRFGELLDEFMRICLFRITHFWYSNKYIYRLSKYKHFLDSIVSEMKSFANKILVEKRDLFQENNKMLITGDIIEDDTKGKSFLDHLLQLSYEGTRLSEKEVADEVNTFLAAGSETTAGALGYAFMSLGMFPDIQQKIYEEVIDILGTDRDVTDEDLPRMQYMERFLKEVLRLFPLVSFILRCTTADIDLGDVILPKDSCLALTIFATHRCPEYWKDPLKFNPDRFLPKEVVKRHPYCYLPFSGGPRNCIGLKYATMIMKTVIATLVRKVVFKSEYKSIEEIEFRIHIVIRPVDGYKVSVELRK